MAVPIQSVGKLGDPYTNLPKVYTRGNFEETALKEKYGSDPSRRDMRQFKRYLKSDAGIADRQTYIDAENTKEQASYSAYAKALGEQSKARMLAAKADFDKAIQKFDTPVEETPQQPQVPQIKPTLTPRSNAEWNRIAYENGFKDMDEVKAWQAANGLTADGKFGNNSSTYFKTNGLGKYQRTQTLPVTPVVPSAPVQTPTPQVETPTVSPTSGFDLDAFRQSQGLKSNAFVTHNGKRYLRYDPSDVGDFYVGEDGSMYRANWGGGVGDLIDHSKHLTYSTPNGTRWERNYNDVYNKINAFKKATINRQGGTMNRINYFQQGGAAPQQQDMQAQIVALVQAAMQGDQKATQTVNQIMEAAKAGDQQAMQIAQIMEQVIKQMQGQAVAAKYGTKLSYLQSLKCGGKSMKKKEQGGKVCPACEQGKQTKKPIVTKHQAGGSFYRNWSPEDVRKLQLFLTGYNGYEGNTDGAVTADFIENVKAYQRANGFKDDGMWGYNTNQVHRVLDSDILSKGSYKSTHKTEQGNLVAHPTDFTYATMKDFSPAEIQKVVNYYSVNPELLYSDDMEHSKWRQVFHNSGKDGADFLNQVAGSLTEEERAKIDPKKLTTQYKTDALVSTVNAGRNRAAAQLLPALAVPTALATGIPVIASGSIPGITGLATGIGGSAVGGIVGEKRGAKKGAKRKDEAYVDPVSERYGVASSVIDPKRRIKEGAEQGRKVGGLVGGIAGSLTGTATAAAAEGGMWNNIGFARAAGNYQGKVTSPNSNMSVYGYDTPGPIQGVSRRQLFKEGLFAPRQFSNGTTRTGGLFGGKYIVNGEIHNPGTPITGTDASALSQAYNSSASPLKINFGGVQGTGRGVKIGQMYSLNPSGIATVGMGVAPMGIIATDAVNDTQPNHPVRQQRRAERREERKERRQDRHRRLVSRTAESTTD